MGSALDDERWTTGFLLTDLPEELKIEGRARLRLVGTVDGAVVGGWIDRSSWTGSIRQSRNDPDSIDASGQYRFCPRIESC